MTEMLNFHVPLWLQCLSLAILILLNTQGALHLLLCTPMGIDYLEIAFDLEVQPFVTHNAA